jgi:hypothetical protein
MSEVKRSDDRRRFWSWLPWQVKLAFDGFFLIAGVVTTVWGLLVLVGILGTPSYQLISGAALILVGGWFLNPIDWWTEEELNE